MKNASSNKMVPPLGDHHPPIGCASTTTTTTKGGAGAVHGDNEYDNSFVQAFEVAEVIGSMQSPECHSDGLQQQSPPPLAEKVFDENKCMFEEERASLIEPLNIAEFNKESREKGKFLRIVLLLYTTL